MAAFPDNVACMIRDGYGEVSPFRKKYHGNRFGDLSKAEMTLTAFTETNDEIKTLERFFLDHGHEPFTVNVPLYGVTRDWLVRMKDTPRTSLKGMTGRGVNMNIILVDDVADYI